MTSATTSTLAAALVCAGLATVPAPAAAQVMPASGAAPVLAIGPGESATTRKVDLSIGRSLIVDLPRDAKEVFVANPKVANAVVRSTRKLFLIGMENGATSIFAMDAEGRQIAAMDVTVGRDLDVLRATLRASLPMARIDARSAGNSVLLTGTVGSASEAQQAIDVANAFVGVAAGAVMGGTRGGVINNLTIRGRDQVMLRVTVAEVARTIVKQFGISTNAGWNQLGRYVGIGNGAASAAPGTTPTWNSQVGSSFPINATPESYLQGGFQAAGVDVNAALRAFERAGVSRILAEPTLTAISGESAKFIAGGEIPVPASRSCAVGGICTTGIEFKPYGVTLNFTPVVLSEGRISLRVGTDVTEIDPQQQIIVETIAVPGTRKRSSETTVELPSGGTMMTAGLLQQVNKQAISGLPGLINLPILGALFRSRDYQRQETELMIFVTPYIAKPMEPAQVARPDDGFVAADDAQSLLLGRFNKLYGTVGAPPLAGGYKGKVGFITD